MNDNGLIWTVRFIALYILPYSAGKMQDLFRISPGFLGRARSHDLVADALGDLGVAAGAPWCTGHGPGCGNAGRWRSRTYWPEAPERPPAVRRDGPPGPGSGRGGRFRSPMTVPRYSSGTMTETFMMGSSRTGSALRHGLLEGHGAGDLERHFGGVHLVIGAVVQGDLHVHHGIAGQQRRPAWRPGYRRRQRGYTPWGWRRPRRR